MTGDGEVTAGRDADGRTNGSTPLVTIGVTCYNAEDTIERAVVSAVGQTWANREVLVVDDASTDGTPCRLAALQRSYPELRVVRHTSNQGCGGARNTLVAEARGEFLAFFDDDDESVPHRLVTQHSRLTQFEERNPGSTVLCYGDRVAVSPDERGARRQWLAIGRSAPEPSGAVVADYVLGVIGDDGPFDWGSPGTCTMMARTKVLRELGAFRADFRRAEDLDLAVRAALRGAHFISVDVPLIRKHITSGDDKGFAIGLRYRLQLIEAHKQYLRSRHSYLGARLNVHAQSYRRQGFRRWRIWRFAALALLPHRWRDHLVNVRRRSAQGDQST